MEFAPSARNFRIKYHRQLDAQRAYPEAFVSALTKAGWPAALIPTEYGGQDWDWRKRRSSWKKSTDPAWHRGCWRMWSRGRGARRLTPWRSSCALSDS